MFQREQFRSCIVLVVHFLYLWYLSPHFGRIYAKSFTSTVGEIVCGAIVITGTPQGSQVGLRCFIRVVSHTA